MHWNKLQMLVFLALAFTSVNNCPVGAENEVRHCQILCTCMCECTLSLLVTFVRRRKSLLQFWISLFLVHCLQNYTVEKSHLTSLWLSSSHSTIKPWLIGCYWVDHPSSRFSHLCKQLLKLLKWPLNSWSLCWLVTQPTIGRVLVVPDFFMFTGTLKALEVFL